jgi:predicted AlkP superfamily phosphohydrolase/phosphomutase
LFKLFFTELLEPYWKIFAIFIAIFALSNVAQAYIGPGAGFAFLYSFFVIFLIVFLAPLFLLIWPAWYLIYRLRSGAWPKDAKVERVVIVGLDGLDPILTEKWMTEGKLPNFRQLGEKGCFHRLGTTFPSVSPVAWSSFQTGVNPAKHNIFDFLDRDLNTYSPILSSAFIASGKKFWKIGKVRIPKGKPVVRLLRKSKPFWKILGENGVFSTILRVPITFPPEKFNGLLLSGMCAPDLKGSQGAFTCYSTIRNDSVTTGGMRISVRWQNDMIQTYISGPVNPSEDNGKELSLPLKIVRTGEAITLGISGREYRLQTGEYSEWIKLNFRTGMGMKAFGICRFYLTQLQPELILYMSPINIDPENPSLPVSHPLYYSVYLAKLFGPFSTLGLAEDTWALNEGILDDAAFLQQVWMNHQERETAFFHALEMTKRGLVVTVFDTSDRIQHMFWRYLETDHPANFKRPLPLENNPIEEMYIKMDDLIGRIQARMGKDEVLMIISDHGFKSFRRCFNINGWLKENGYLHLKEGATGGDFFQNVDWNRTKAYGVGLGGLFINLKGREKAGIVSPGEEHLKLKSEIKGRLESLIDPENGNPVFHRIYDIAQTGKGPYSKNGPDLLFGFNPGYRISWDSVTGGVEGPILSDNIKKWSGDHGIDPVQVPGIFFCNREIELDNPDLRDISATCLDLFGVKKPDYIEGRALIKKLKVKARDKS